MPGRKGLALAWQHLSAELPDDVSGQHRNIFPALPQLRQRRHGKPYDFQPVKQTLSESLFSKASAAFISYVRADGEAIATKL